MRLPFGNKNRHDDDDNTPPEPYNGAGPTDDLEEDVLRAEFGRPNQDGIYGAVVVE